MNPANFDGVSYWHKGVAHTVRVDIPQVTDYDNHQIRIPESSDWTLVTVDFSTLNQGGWGKKVALNLDNSFKMVWNLEVSSGSFMIDDIKFVKEIKYQKENNMLIRASEIPTPVLIKGNVNTPLNDLSKKYLTKGMNLAS